jgi:hypothetical protein
MEHQCNKEQVLEIILNEVKEIKEIGSKTSDDIKSLLKFKWQVMAVVSTVSIIISAGLSIFVAILK